MIWLVFMVLLNALIAVLFKLFGKFGINHFQAIIFNYWVCVITGSLFLGSFPIGRASFHADWRWLCLFTGAGFVSIFNLFAYCTKTNGITAATVANKLSLVIPVALSVYLYKEVISSLHGLAIVLAIPAVILASAPTRTPAPSSVTSKRVFSWSIPLLFAGSGLLDTIVKFAQQSYLHTTYDQASYTIHLFAVAGSLGTLALLVLFLRGQMLFSWRNVAGGIILGVPNYFSIYCFIRMLNSNVLKSSALIPTANIGVLVASVLAAIIFFSERPNARNIFGLLLSLLVIIMLAYA